MPHGAAVSFILILDSRVALFPPRAFPVISIARDGFVFVLPRYLVSDDPQKKLRPNVPLFR